MRNVRRMWIAFAAVALLAVPALVLAAPVTVNWWHAHGGALGEKVNAICDGFNKSQTQYQVVPTYKGSYSDTMNAGIAAFRAKAPPHILQVFEVGTATMMAAKGAIKPVYEVMKQSGLPFDPDVYLPTVDRLLHHHRRQDAVHAFQQLYPNPLLQYRCVSRRPAWTPTSLPKDLARGRRRPAKKLVAAGAQFPDRVIGHSGLERLDPYRKSGCLAQRPVWDQVQRVRGPGCCATPSTARFM